MLEKFIELLKKYNKRKVVLIYPKDHGRTTILRQVSEFKSKLKED